MPSDLVFNSYKGMLAFIYGCPDFPLALYSNDLKVPKYFELLKGHLLLSYYSKIESIVQQHV